MIRIVLIECNYIQFLFSRRLNFDRWKSGLSFGEVFSGCTLVLFFSLGRKKRLSKLNAAVLLSKLNAASLFMLNIAICFVYESFSDQSQYHLTGEMPLCYTCGLRNFKALAYLYRYDIPQGELPGNYWCTTLCHILLPNNATSFWHCACSHFVLVIL